MPKRVETIDASEWAAAPSSSLGSRCYTCRWIKANPTRGGAWIQDAIARVAAGTTARSYADAWRHAVKEFGYEKDYGTLLNHVKRSHRVAAD